VKQEDEAASGERERVAEELRRIRESVRERALLERTPGEVLPAPTATRTPEPVPREPEPPPAPPVPRPDGAAVNALWEVTRAPLPGGLRGRLAGLVRRLLGRVLDTQVAFNSRQVQLDNEILAYIDARFEATHRHYDAVLGLHGRHMGEIDERHLILQEELVAHVHDLVRRIDLVLSEAERGRLGLEFSLRQLRESLKRLEERPPRG
jgi:hypothetical protein